MKKITFTVRLPKFYSKCMFIGVALFVIFPVPFTIFSGPQHIALYVLSGILSFSFLLLMIWSKRFKVKVCNQKISVRKGLISSFSFDVSDIVSVELKTAENRFVQTHKFLIRTSSGKKLSIENLMVNFEKMAVYIVENVDANKINKIYINLNK